MLPGNRGTWFSAAHREQRKQMTPPLLSPSSGMAQGSSSGEGDNVTGGGCLSLSLAAWGCDLKGEVICVSVAGQTQDVTTCQWQCAIAGGRDRSQAPGRWSPQGGEVKIFLYVWNKSTANPNFLSTVFEVSDYHCKWCSFVYVHLSIICKGRTKPLGIYFSFSRCT